MERIANARRIGLRVMAGAIQDGVVGIAEVHGRCYRLFASSRSLAGFGPTEGAVVGGRSGFRWWNWVTSSEHFSRWLVGSYVSSREALPLGQVSDFIAFVVHGV